MTPRDLELAELGWRPCFSAQLSEAETVRLEPVRVMSVHRGTVTVAGAGIERSIASSVPGSGSDETHITVGDWLLLDPEAAQATRILDRANLFKRRAPGKVRDVQLIAANIDRLFIVASCNADFNLARIERYLILARDVGVYPVVVLTKADLADDPGAFAQAARSLQPGLDIVVVNGRDRNSAAALATWCGFGTTVAFLGSSGVGKSTLINSLTGSAEIATQGIRAGDGKGRHTTTVRQMHRLEQGGWLLDTPGMRELQLADAAEGIGDVFADILALAESCRFSDCAHQGEPDCAVRAAVNASELDPARLDRWRKLTAEDASNTLSLAERRQRTRHQDHKGRSTSNR